MGSRPLCVIACALASCKPDGLLVEVNGTNVELFVAMSQADCDTPKACPIAPPNPMTPSTPGMRVAAQRWLDDTDQAIEKEVDGDTTRFLLQTDAGDTGPIPAMLALSFDQPGVGGTPVAFAVLHDIDVPAAKQRRLIVDLAPAAATNAGGDRIQQVWRKPSDAVPAVMPSTLPTLAPCVLVGHAPGSMPAFESFSPQGDTDCDETEKVKDCDPFAAFATALPASDALTCLTMPPASTACRLGGIGCIDGIGPTPNGGCTPGREAWCMSDRFCAQVDGNTMCSIGTPCFSGIMRQYLGLGTGLHCYVAIDSTTRMPCATSGSTTIDLGPLVANAAQMTCQEIELSDDVSPLAFNGSVTLASSQLQLTVNVASGGATCGGMLTESNTHVVPALSSLGYLEVKLQNPTHHRVIPMEVEWQPGTCGGSNPPFRCDPVLPVEATDGFSACQ